jgi:hypothetical protein
MQSNLAPIGLSTYSRISHLKQTVDALQKNTLAKQSELFIFSDAPKQGDESKVEAVRHYLRTVNGFKSVNVIEREENSRIKNSRGGMRMLLERYGRMIFLEEDIITAPYFLSFMNQALEQYQHDTRIFSVSAYCPPINIPDDYELNIFFLKRFNAWGFGIWKDRFEQVKNISPDEYEHFIADKQKKTQFGQEGGEDMLAMLKLDAYGEIDAFDVKAMYAQFLSNQYTIYPTESLTINNGMDGTGLHCGKTTKFSVMLSTKNVFSFPEQMKVDLRIVGANRNFRSLPGFAMRIISRLKNFTNRRSDKC